MRYLLVCCLTCLLLPGCYENRSGCLDPTAANYDLSADEACEDGCCNYPTLSVRVNSTWGDTAVVTGATYADVRGDSFQLIRFRYYLGELRLASSIAELVDPQRPVTLQSFDGVDSTELSLNGNYLLASLATTTTTIGVIAGSDASLNALSGTYGLPDRYRGVVPASAPSGDALRTQPGRLNYRDGRGYVQARLEYTLEPGGDTLSASSYGSVPFTLAFGEEIRPLLGLDIRLDLEARLDDLIGAIELSGDTASVAGQLGRAVDFLSVVGFTQ